MRRPAGSRRGRAQRHRVRRGQARRARARLARRFKRAVREHPKVLGCYAMGGTRPAGSSCRTSRRAGVLPRSPFEHGWSPCSSIALSTSRRRRRQLSRAGALIASGSGSPQSPGNEESIERPAGEGLFRPDLDRASVSARFSGFNCSSRRRELQRVAGGVEQEHRRLLAGRSLEPRGSICISPASRIACPRRHQRQDDTAMGHRLMTVGGVRDLADLRCPGACVRSADELVAEDEDPPVRAAAPFAAAERPVKRRASPEVATWTAMERGRGREIPSGQSSRRSSEQLTEMTVLAEARHMKLAPSSTRHSATPASSSSGRFPFIASTRVSGPQSGATSFNSSGSAAKARAITVSKGFQLMASSGHARRDVESAACECMRDEADFLVVRIDEREAASDRRSPAAVRGSPRPYRHPPPSRRAARLTERLSSRW